MCRRLGVSRSGYYAWCRRRPRRNKERDQYLAVRIRAIFEEKRGLYGSPRILDALRDMGESVGRNRVIRIMQSEGLIARRRKRFRFSAKQSESQTVAGNILQRQFSPSRPNMVWVSDITSIHTWEGFLHLSVVIDLYSRRVVGWSVKNHMKTDLPLEALKMGLARRSVSEGLLLHSDQGSQYTSDLFQNFLKETNITCSMSRKGNCWDNAVVESFFATIKKELLNPKKWKTFAQASEAIEDYIENFYNVTRRHSTLGNMSPMEYERSNASA